MTTGSNTPQDKHETRHNVQGRAIGGVILIALGIMALLPQVTHTENLELFFLPALAVIFLAWGLVARSFGPLIPGCIVGSLGACAVLAERSYPDEEGGIYVLALAAGFLLLSLLSLVTREGFRWWPLIPGGILAVIGGALVSGEIGQTILNVLSYAVPAALIIVGGYLLLRRRSNS